MRWRISFLRVQSFVSRNKCLSDFISVLPSHYFHVRLSDSSFTTIARSVDFSKVSHCCCTFWYGTTFELRNAGVWWGTKLFLEICYWGGEELLLKCVCKFVTSPSLIFAWSAQSIFFVKLVFLVIRSVFNVLTVWKFFDVGGHPSSGFLYLYCIAHLHLFFTLPPCLLSSGGLIFCLSLQLEVGV